MSAVWSPMGEMAGTVSFTMRLFPKWLSPTSGETSRACSPPVLKFSTVYDENFDFVWRIVQRMGVPAASADDVVQEVFLVVHRRLDSFEGRSKVRTWLFGIATRVVSTHRRTAARKRRVGAGAGGDPDALSDDRSDDPHDVLAQRQAREILATILQDLDPRQRDVFVLAELEQMTAPEIAEMLEVNLNTVYSRLRAARRCVNEAATRFRTADGSPSAKGAKHV